MHNNSNEVEYEELNYIYQEHNHNVPHRFKCQRNLANALFHKHVVAEK